MPTATHPAVTTMTTMKMKQANMSLAAMEAALKPQVLETLDLIARDYVNSAVRNAGQLRISATLNEDDSFSKKEEGAYQKLRSLKLLSW